MIARNRGIVLSEDKFCCYLGKFSKVLRNSFLEIKKQYETTQRAVYRPTIDRILAKHQPQAEQCSEQRRQGNDYAHLDETDVTKLQAVLFENIAPHYAC